MSPVAMIMAENQPGDGCNTTCIVAPLVLKLPHQL